MSEQKLGPNQQKWYDELMTTDLPQGKEELEDFWGGYCCLGIACKAAYESGVQVNFNADGSLIGYDLADQVYVIDWLGLYDRGGTSIDHSVQALWKLNDNDKYSFKQIAEQIKMYPEKYFREEK